MGHSNKGALLSNCILLIEEAARKRDIEEEARLHATSTTIKDCKIKKRISLNYA